jgi:acetylglutamate kinase
MRVLIKIGGALLDSPESRARLAGEISAAVKTGASMVVVHGGGRQMTGFLAERGVESRFLNGLRVTTPQVMDAVLKVLAGSVNRELVASFIAKGARAVGLTGMDALLTEAQPISEELGLVGKPVQSDPRLLTLLTESGYLPIIACVAGDRQGRFYNVNGDQMAASVAAAIRADKLLFLTDVAGVRGKSNAIYPTLSLSDCQNLIDTGVAEGGMRAKLEAASEAIRQGIPEVVVAPGAVSGVIEKLLAGIPLGTRLVAETEVPQIV